jgi:hypothetical protein
MPELPSEQKPIFRLGYTGGLVCRRELRTEEAFLKSFTPFVNKKKHDYLKRLRTALFEPSGDEASLIDRWLSLGGIRTEQLTIEQQEEIHNMSSQVFPEEYDAPPVPDEPTEQSTVTKSEGTNPAAPSYITAEKVRNILNTLERQSTASTSEGGAMPTITAEEEEVVETSEQIINAMKQLNETEKNVSKLREGGKMTDLIRGVTIGLKVDLLRASIMLQDKLQKVDKNALLSIRAQIPERKELMSKLHVHLREDGEFMKEHPLAKAWEAFFNSKNLTTKAQRGEFAETRFKDASERNLYIGKGAATNLAAINAGLARANKVPPGTKIGLITEGKEWLKGKQAALGK